MSEEKDKSDLDSKAKEIGKTIAETFVSEVEAISQEKEAKEAKAAEKAVAEKAEIADPPSYTPHESMNKMYGIGVSSFDKAIERDFGPANIKSFVGPQGDPERINMKGGLLFRAVVGMKMFPHDARFAYAAKALSEGTNADGGFLVDPEYRGEVLTQLHNTGVMRPEVNVMPTTKDSVTFNSEDGRPKVSWGSENTSISTTTAGFAQTTISVFRMNSIMYLSREVVADSDPAILDYIRNELVTSVALEEDAVIIGGDGTTQPTGIKSLSLTTTAAGSTLSFEDYLDLVNSLPIQYQRAGNVKFFMNQNTLTDAYKMKDDQSMPIYVRDMAGKTPGSLLGYPIVIHNNFADGTIYFGDMKRTYNLLDRQQLAIETTTEGGNTWANHQVGIKVTERIGGNAIRTEGLKKGTGFSA